ncbi:MAG: hypothetical protein ACLFN0_05265 [Thermovirgaceae bacterium]
MRKTIVLVLSFMAVTLVFLQPSSAEEAFTPAWGTPERKAVLDVMRDDIRNRFDLEVVFVVRWMKVKGGWCFALTEPQSVDGSQRYETYGALLEAPCDEWTVREVMPLEEGFEEKSWLASLKEKYPDLPEEIFPGHGEKKEIP